MSEGFSQRGRWLWPALLAGCALAVLTGRLVWDARSALLAGQRAQARGDSADAVRCYLDAARLYVPANPYNRHALDALGSLADTAQKTGDRAIERQALEAIRAAVLGTRSFYAPFAERLPGVQERLADLYAAIEEARNEPVRGASTESLAARRAWHAGRLATRPGPSTPAVLVIFVGLALWLGAAVAFLRKGLDASLHWRRGPAIASGVVCLVGLVIFLVALRLA